MIAKGLTDLGTNGSVVRSSKLPQALNLAAGYQCAKHPSLFGISLSHQ
jgi:hypothetical protein